MNDIQINDMQTNEELATEVIGSKTKIASVGDCTDNTASKDDTGYKDGKDCTDNKNVNYSKLLQGILDIAEEMLVAGAEVSRIEDSVTRMCIAYGCDRVNVFVITSNIQVTMEDPNGEIITQIRRVIRNDTNFDRVDYLNDLSRYVCANLPSDEELHRKIDEVLERKQQPFYVGLISGAVIGASFAVFFGGNLSDALASGIVGLLTVLLNRRIGKFSQNPLAVVFAVSFLAGLLSVLTVYLGIGEHTDKIMIGVIMLLIPGIALTNGVRDMLTGDIAAGMLRVANAVLIATAIACGFALSLFVTGGGLI